MRNTNEQSRLMQDLFCNIAPEIARKTNFIQRKRKFDAGEFLRNALTCCLQRLPTLYDFQAAFQEQHITISEAGICKRFNSNAAEFFKAMLGITIQKLVAGNKEILPLTSGFNGIVVDDCTIVNMTADLAAALPGCGGSDGKSGKAAVKTFCRFEVLSGSVQTLLHAPGKTSDKKMLEQAASLPKGCLHLIDRGFFDIDDLRSKSEQGIRWITRIPAGTTVLVGKKEMDWMTFLKTNREDYFDVSATLGKGKYAVRLVGFRVDTETAARHNRNAERTNQKHGRSASESQKVLCQWAVYATNLLPQEYGWRDVCTLYRVRWQIELLFKLWKSEGGMDKSNGVKGWRCLCEFYIKLLGCVIANWLMLLRCGQLGGVSAVKMFRVVHRRMAELYRTFDEVATRECLRQIEADLLKIPIQHQRKKNPSTRQLLTTKDVTA
jgi:hypothetical protein